MRRTWSAAGHHGAGVAGRDDGVGLAGGDQLEADDQRRVGLRAHGARRLVAGADDVGGVDDADVLLARCQRRAEALLAPTKITCRLLSGCVERPLTTSSGAWSPPMASTPRARPVVGMALQTSVTRGRRVGGLRCLVILEVGHQAVDIDTIVDELGDEVDLAALLDAQAAEQAAQTVGRR